MALIWVAVLTVGRAGDAAPALVRGIGQGGQTGSQT